MCKNVFNDKGFAISALLYPAFIIIITITVLVLITLIQSSFSMNKLTTELQGDMTDNNTMKSLKQNTETFLEKTKGDTKVYTATDGKIFYFDSDGKKIYLDLNNEENTDKWLGKIFTKADGTENLLIDNSKYCAYKVGNMSGVAVYNSGECADKIGQETNCSDVIKLLDDTNTISDLETQVKSLNDQLTILQNQIKTINANVANQHPVGSFYITQDTANPTTLFGGTWTLIKDRFLIGAGGSYAVTSTGGSATHSHVTNATYTDYWSGTTGGPSTNVTGSTTLTAAQSGLPNHSHGVRVSWGDNDSRWSNVWLAYGDTYGLAVDKGFASFDTGGWNASQGHTHTLSNHTHSIPSHRHYIAATGTSSASSIPPYYAVYIWLRTGL